MPLGEKESRGGKENGQDQLVTRKAGGANLADVGGGSGDNLVQSALCHLAMGKAGYEFKIAASPLFREESLTWDLGPVTCDLEGRCSMHTIQSFLVVVLCGFVWLTIILSLALAEEITIYDKDWQVKEGIQDGTIYDRDWKVKGHIEDGKNHEMSRKGAKFAKDKRIPSEDFSRSLKSLYPGLPLRTLRLCVRLAFEPGWIARVARRLQEI